MPIDDLEDDDYPNDWFAPQSSRTVATQPNDWTDPANGIAPALTATPATSWWPQSPQFTAANPFPTNPSAAVRPDPFSPFWPLALGGNLHWPLALGSNLQQLPWIPPTLPDVFGRFPPTPSPSLPGLPQLSPAGGLFASLPDLQAAPSFQTGLPSSGLLSTTANPTGAVAPPGIPTLGVPQDPSAPLSGMHPISNLSTSSLSASPSQANSSLLNQPWTTPLNLLRLAAAPFLKLPPVGSLSSAGPTTLPPADFSALPIVTPQPLSFADQGSSPEAPSGANGDLLTRILNFINPISPAYAVDDDGEIPPAELEALLHLLNPEVAKRLIEQNRFLEEFRKDVEEVRAGRGSSRALARYLEISGVKRPPGYAAHHIAAGNDPRAEIARNVLKRFGIGINDAVNGVFLPANRATQVIAGKTTHSTLHTDAYYEAVNKALRGATTRQEVLDTLQRIGKALEAGDYP